MEGFCLRQRVNSQKTSLTFAQGGAPPRDTPALSKLTTGFGNGQFQVPIGRLLVPFPAEKQCTLPSLPTSLLYRRLLLHTHTKRAVVCIFPHFERAGLLRVAACYFRC